MQAECDGVESNSNAREPEAGGLWAQGGYPGRLCLEKETDRQIGGASVKALG